MSHVFISYSREDQDYARTLADDLRERGIEPWNDEDIEHGARWWRTIVKAIQGCAVFVVVMTPESEESRWVEREILLAEDEGKPILPLLLRGKRNPLLIGTQHANVIGGRMPPKRFYDRLRRALPAPELPTEPTVEKPPVPKRRSEKLEAPPTPRVKTPGKKPAQAVRADFEPELVYIPEGSFLMGSVEREGYDDERPQHTVTLSDYWIGKYPVTNLQYQAFIREAGHRSPQKWNGDAYPEGKGEHPVVYVSWDDAAAYCKWLGKKTGKKYGLPTEAQWEKATRGNDGRIYPWGDEWDAARLNSREGGPGDTSPVGQYSPKGDSPYGCADVAGNVWEWCADWYDENEYARRAGSSVEDPTGPESGTSRVLRGGSFYGSGRYVRCAARSRRNPYARRDLIGFRIFLRP